MPPSADAHPPATIRPPQPTARVSTSFLIPLLPPTLDSRRPNQVYSICKCLAQLPTASIGPLPTPLCPFAHRCASCRNRVSRSFISVRSSRWQLTTTQPDRSLERADHSPRPPESSNASNRTFKHAVILRDSQRGAFSSVWTTRLPPLPFRPAVAP